MKQKRSLFARLKEMFTHSDDFSGVGHEPFRHYFPDVGLDGAVTINCIVTPSARAWGKNARAEELANGRVTGIEPKRVGAMVVELDEYGLTFRWESAEGGNELVRSPFSTGPSTPPRGNQAAKCTK